MNYLFDDVSDEDTIEENMVGYDHDSILKQRSAVEAIDSSYRDLVRVFNTLDTIEDISIEDYKGVLTWVDSIYNNLGTETHTLPPHESIKDLESIYSAEVVSAPLKKLVESMKLMVSDRLIKSLKQSVGDFVSNERIYSRKLKSIADKVMTEMNDLSLSPTSKGTLSGESIQRSFPNGSHEVAQQLNTLNQSRSGVSDILSELSKHMMDIPDTNKFHILPKKIVKSFNLRNKNGKLIQYVKDRQSSHAGSKQLKDTVKTHLSTNVLNGKYLEMDVNTEFGIKSPQEYITMRYIKDPSRKRKDLEILTKTEIVTILVALSSLNFSLDKKYIGKLTEIQNNYNKLIVRAVKASAKEDIDKKFIHKEITMIKSMGRSIASILTVITYQHLRLHSQTVDSALRYVVESLKAYVPSDSTRPITGTTLASKLSSVGSLSKGVSKLKNKKTKKRMINRRTTRTTKRPDFKG